MTAKIKYVKGNALEPKGKGDKLIAHICNNVGGWGSGFVVAVSKKWKKPERLYREWHYLKDTEFNRHGPFELGWIQGVPVEDDITIINMIAQDNHATGTGDYGRQYVDYEALRRCLTCICLMADTMPKFSVHMPRIGCGLGGGKWEEIEIIINETLIKKGLKVTVYDLE